MEDEVGTGVWIIVFLFFGLLITGAVFVVKFFDIDFSSGNEIKAYSATCKTRVENNICDRPLLPQKIIIYKVSYSQQQVISSAGGLVSKFTDCIVRDKRNWKCNFGDKSGEFGFISGEFYRDINWDMKMSAFVRNSLEKFYYPSRFEYIDLQAKRCKDIPYSVCYFFGVLLN